ncbi:MAG: ferritin [Pseudomonadota bacterium]
MELNQKVATALNAQLNSEWNASYVYMAMSAYFDDLDFNGFGTWMRGHAKEEMGHAQRIYDFLVARSHKPHFAAIAEPASDFTSPTAAIQAALEHERSVTKQIYALFDLAHAEKEYSTQNMLNWFLAEQVEEEDLFQSILKKVEAASESKWHMFALDREVGGG